MKVNKTKCPPLLKQKRALKVEIMQRLRSKSYKGLLLDRQIAAKTLRSVLRYVSKTASKNEAVFG